MAVVLLVIAACLPAAARAQDPEEKPDAPHAYVRFWNMLPDTPANNLMLLAGEKKGLSIVPPGNVLAGYQATPPGSYTLMVKRLDEKSGALRHLPVVLADQTFITLLATEKNGQPTVELFDDTPDPKVVEAFARITLRQFFPGARVKVSVVGGPSSQTLDYGQTGVLENVPPNGQTSLLLQAVLPTTPPSSRTWHLTGNFAAGRHSTLLLVADSYGRFRPRLAYDALVGPPPDATPAPAPVH